MTKAIIWHTADFTVDLKNNSVAVLNGEVEPRQVTLVDAGEKTPTGDRLQEDLGDTLRDKHILEQMWAAGNDPWRCW